MALEQRPILTLDLTKKMAAGCEEKARKGGSKMNIAILDIGGNEKYFLRQDDAFLKSGQIAHMTASTSAGLPFSTKQVGAIGVSGGTADQDGICAQAGVDGVKSELM